MRMANGYVPGGLEDFMEYLLLGRQFVPFFYKFGGH